MHRPSAWKRPAAALLAGLLLPDPAAALDCSGEHTTPAAVKGMDGEPLPPGETVTVRGRIGGAFLGGDRLDGFFLQARTDGRPAGVFVYTPEPEPGWTEILRPDRRVAVRARTDRYRGRIQLHRVEAVADCGRAPVEPAALDWPPDVPLEALAGVRVRLTRPLTVTGHHELGRYGSLHLASERLFHPNSAPPGDPEAPVLVLDDGSYSRDPRPIPHLDPEGSRRVGDRVTALTGVLTRAFDAWRLHPTQAPDFEAANPRPEAPESPGETERRVGLVNLGNYFLTPGERGADTIAEREDQETALGRLVAGIDADVLAVVELENRAGAPADLAERVAGAGFRAVEGPERLGEDAIRNALLYRPDRVRPVGTPRVARHEAFVRPPLAQRFRSEEGHAFTVVVAHFKSKGGCPEAGDVDRGEGCWSERRLREARALAAWAADLPRPVLLAGDLNAYAREAPIRHLRRAGFRDLLRAALPARDRYTYVYRGRSGYLDHLLLRGGPEAEAGRWPVNADEPQKVPEPDSVWRATDHDPVWVDLPASAP
ncbi:MAG: ExeM/NucH family extracellular endonuclease [Thiohalorhabdus sp.]|uniref:ExeM/NucH family extracellular endonuclease n=1 Tax=Thiohalorhabdus sp. TaxID=3094134 RepID=UPI00397FBD8D